ncbi:unnamed protein product [Staurois parvus]|uniref:C2H2-type domain-containing protein n=1 Tax=Staurois parvus TaxID=386267 RepID=A0ABN9EJP0_9NEOB|nr:unnamed protein product [Staurois parvus]
MYVHRHTCTCTHTCTRTCTYTQTHVQIHTCAYTQPHTHISIKSCSTLLFTHRSGVLHTRGRQ